MGILENQTDTSKSVTRPFCENSGSLWLCTFFYPDHPNAGTKKGNYSPFKEMEIPKNQSNTLKGMPTKCRDLQLLGHKLNGLYLVKAIRPTNQGIEIGTVFCDFQSPTTVNGTVILNS